MRGAMRAALLACAAGGAAGGAGPGGSAGGMAAGIPRIIHLQRWGQARAGNDLRDAAVRSIERHFPRDAFTHVISDLEDNRRCMEAEFPDFVGTFDGLPTDIMRSDMGRCCLLYKHGGIYIDTDFEVLDNFHSALSPGHVSIVESPYKSLEEVQNSLMASPPGHPFWLRYFESIVRASEASRASGSWRENAVFITGPALLTEVAEVPRDSSPAALRLAAPAVKSGRSDVRVLSCAEYNRPVTPSSYFPIKDCGSLAWTAGLRSLHWQLSEWLVRDPDVNEHLRSVCGRFHPGIDCRGAYHDPPSIVRELAELRLKAPELDPAWRGQRVAQLQRRMEQYLSRAHWDMNRTSATTLSMYEAEFLDVLHNFGPHAGLQAESRVEL